MHYCRQYDEFHMNLKPTTIFQVRTQCSPTYRADDEIIISCMGSLIAHIIQRSLLNYVELDIDQATTRKGDRK